MSLSGAISELAAADSLLVVTDFDGTIAPLVEEPALARLLRGAAGALSRLSKCPGTSVAILSGRRLDELKGLVGPLPGVTLVGEHGSAWDDDPGDSDELVRRLAIELEDIASQTPGATVEVKRWSVAFHYRRVDDELADVAAEAVLAGPARAPGVSVTHGKKVIELHVTERTKGDAMVELRRRAGDGPALFVGDDVTDETVFRRLGAGDVGVKVGSGESAASFRVAGPDEVVALLELLAAERGCPSGD